MANEKIYSIKINGVSESTNAVDSLNKQLDVLTSKLNELEKKNVKIKVPTQQAEQAKKAYKEVIAEQKQVEANERLVANAYENTMKGMKQHLSDIKKVMQTTDLGENDTIAQLTSEASELTTKLKEMEEAYGQFGRNVGNYKSAFDGLDKIKVVVNGVTREFDNLRQAQRALTNAMGTLEVNGKKDTAMYKQMEKELEKVSKAQLRLNSTMKDAKTSSQAMDEVLDMFESFTAMQQVGRGFSTFFGIDDSAIEKQIAKLVALQNVLQGIEKIRQQMNTGEGIGGILNVGSNAVDSFVMKITGAQKRMGMLVATTREETIAVQRLAAGLKLVGGAAIVGGVMLVTTAIGKIIDDFKRWKTGGYEAGTATDVLNKQLEVLQTRFDSLKKDIDARFFNNFMTDEEYAIEKTNTLTFAVSRLLNELGKLEKTDFSKPKASILGGINLGYGKDEDKALENATKRFTELAQKIDKIENANGSSFGKWVKSFFGFEDDLDRWTREFQDLGESLAQNLLYEMQQAAQAAREEIEKTGKVSQQTKYKIQGLSIALKNDLTTNSILANIDKFSKKGQYYVSQINLIKDSFIDLGKQIGYMDVDPDRIVQLQIDSMKDGLAKQKKQIDLNRKKELADAGENETLIRAIKDKYRRQEIEAEKAHSKEMAAAYADLASIRIQLMREGWAKQKKELEHERDERIRQIEESEKLVGERTAATRELYRKKILQAEQDWDNKMLQVNRQLAENIESVRKDAFAQEVENAEQNIANKQAQKKNDLWERTLDIANPNNVERRRKYFEEILKIDMEASKKQQAITQENLDKQQEFNTREEENRHEMVANAKTVSMVLQEVSKIPNPSDEDFAKIEAKLKEQLSLMRGELVDAYNAGEIDFKSFVSLIENEEDAHTAKMKAIQNQYNIETSAKTQAALDEQKQLYNTYYTEVLSTIRTKQDEIANKMQKMPVADNPWGVVQLSVSSRNYKNALKEYENLRKDVVGQKQALLKDLVMNNITAEDFLMKNSELDAMLKSVDEAIKEVKEKRKNLIGDFMQSIMTYVQTAGQTLNSIIGSLSEITQNQYEAQISQQEKYIEQYEKLLDKQKEATQKYADEVNSIEDELKTARGDRRQELIDQLNAQMAAQRASLAEEKRIEKEKEKAEQQKKKLEHDQAVAKKDMDLAQAYINAAMAVSMAAVNKWPVPAIPMMAMAAAAAAAQIAAIKSQNIPSYGSGGLLEGKSHKEGGIKTSIGNSPIELEGQEYVIRKKSTADNIPVLDFINRSERKLNLGDFIDFYSSNKVKKSIVSANPRTKFESGGMLPLMSNDIELNDRLVNVMEDYSNRPVVVSVVDINDRQAAVRNVEVLSGLNE